MAHPKQTKDKCRAAYVQGLQLPAAAQTAGVGLQTARNWKRDAATAGDDWDVARAARLMSHSSIDDLTGTVLEGLCEQYVLTLDALKADRTISPMQKAEMLARLSDGYTKTLAAAGRANPRLAKLAVGMDVLKDMAQFVADSYPKERKWFVDMIEAYGPIMAQRLG